MATKVQLPSGRVVTLERRASREPCARDVGNLLEAREAFTSGDVSVRDAASRTSVDLDVDELPLRDFHALRAIAARKGWLTEEPVEITCANCGEPIEHGPCAAMPLGPFEERALDDPELDATLDFDSEHALPSGKTVRLGPVTLGEARPLHVAVTRGRPLRFGPALVRAMGVVAFGKDTAPERIARSLRACSDEDFAEVCDLFLRAHYPPRLFSMARCPACGARNDVDAPYDREVTPAADARRAGGGESNAKLFVDFDAFAERARRRFAELVTDGAPHAPILLVEAGVAACDDGGVPLLGSYVPPVLEGDAHDPVRPAEVTVFYRTFRAIWDDEGPYDWEAELDETVEHELEHHEGWLTGSDPMDEEERRAIDDEAARVHGKRALLAGEVRALGADVGGFWRKTWPLWILLLAVGLVLALQQFQDMSGD